MEKHKTGFTCGEMKILGFQFTTSDGKSHFCPSLEYIDKYIDAYIDSQKIFRAVNKITKELK